MSYKLKSVSVIFLSIFIICISAVVFTACEGNTNGERQREITKMKVVLQDEPEEYMTQCYEQAVDEGEIAQVENGTGIEVVMCGSVEEQIREIEDAVNKKLDCIIIYPFKSDSVSKALNKAMKSGISVILYSERLNTPTKIIPNAGFYYDMDEFGKDNVKLFNDFYNSFKEESGYNGKLDIVAFYDSDNFIDKKLYKIFQRDIDSNLHIISQFETSSRIKAMNEFEDWLDKSDISTISNVRAIYTQSDECALGVLDAIQNYTGNAKLKIQLISSIGASKSGVENIVSAYEDLGIKQVTFNYTPVNIREAIRYGLDIISGKLSKDSVGYEKIFKIDAVSKDNVREFEKSNGYITRYSIEQED